MWFYLIALMTVMLAHTKDPYPCHNMLEKVHLILGRRWVLLAK